MEGGTGLAVGASRVEETIAALAATVERQQRELDALLSEVRSRPTVHDLHSLRDAAMAGLRSLEERVSRAEANLNVPGLGHPDVAGGAETPGDAVAWLITRSDSAWRRMDGAATKDGLATATETLRTEMAVAVDGLDGRKASKRALAALEQAVSAAGRRCDALDSALARKADVSVLPSLEAAAAVVAEEGDAIRSLRRGAAETVGRVSALEHGLRGELERGEQTASVLEGLGRALAGKASLAEVAAVAKRADRLERGLREARAEAAAEAEASRTRAEAAAGDAVAAARAAQGRADEAAASVTELGERVDGCARLEDAWPRERGEALEAAAAALRRAIDSRATKESATSALSGVSRLTSQLRAAEAKLAVALDFVDWYSAKGDALEHNERVIHAELGKMAVAGAHRDAAERAARDAVA